MSYCHISLCLSFSRVFLSHISLSLSVSVSVCLSVSVSVSLCLSLSCLTVTHLSLCLSLSVCLSVSLTVTHAPLSLSRSRSLNSAFSLSPSTAFLSTLLSYFVFLRSVCLSVCLFVRLSSHRRTHCVYLTAETGSRGGVEGQMAAPASRLPVSFISGTHADTSRGDRGILRVHGGTQLGHRNISTLKKFLIGCFESSQCQSNQVYNRCNCCKWRQFLKYYEADSAPRHFNSSTFLFAL